MVRIALALALVHLAAAADGETIEEKAAVCAACHGMKGIPEDMSTPIIWGQNAGYLYIQFRDFQKGVRTNDRMTPVARNVVKEGRAGAG